MVAVLSLAASIGMGNLLYTSYSDEPFVTSLAITHPGVGKSVRGLVDGCIV